MSAVAPLTLHELQRAITTGGLDAQIQEVAVMASVGLAVLTYFIDRQATTLAKLCEKLENFEKKEIQHQLGLDVALGVLAVAGLVAVAPFVAPLFEALHLFHRTGALRVLFLIIVGGYLALALFQASIIYRRTDRLKAKH